MIVVYLNGRQTPVEAGTSLDSLLHRQQQSLNLPVETPMAVELNTRVIRRQDWSMTPLGDGDRIEIVRLVGGG